MNEDLPDYLLQNFANSPAEQQVNQVYGMLHRARNLSGKLSHSVRDAIHLASLLVLDTMHHPKAFREFSDRLWVNQKRVEDAQKALRAISVNETPAESQISDFLRFSDEIRVTLVEILKIEGDSIFARTSAYDAYYRELQREGHEPPQWQS